MKARVLIERLAMLESKFKDISKVDIETLSPKELDDFEKQVKNSPFIGPEEMGILDSIRILKSGGFDAQAGKRKKSKRVTNFSRSRT